MKRQLFTRVSAGIFALAIGAVAAEPTPARDADEAQVVSQLEQRAKRLEWQAQGTKGAPRAALEQQRLRVRKLAERLKAGESVDPQEIDKLLRQGRQ
jgi:hypothetical protein